MTYGRCNRSRHRAARAQKRCHLSYVFRRKSPIVSCFEIFPHTEIVQLIGELFEFLHVLETFPLNKSDPILGEQPKVAFLKEKCGRCSLPVEHWMKEAVFYRRGQRNGLARNEVDVITDLWV